MAKTVQDFIRSLPFKILILVFCSMAVIFGIETIGLGNKGHNIEFRQDHVTGLSSQNLFKTEIKLIEKMEGAAKSNGRNLNLVEKEDKLNKMFDMLKDNAYMVNNDDEMITDF